VIIAHAGAGWPVDTTVSDAASVAARETERDTPARRVYFELSAVAIEEASEGVSPMTADEAVLLRRLAETDSTVCSSGPTIPCSIRSKAFAHSRRSSDSRRKR
jgi:hypothetical protein